MAASSRRTSGRPLSTTLETRRSALHKNDAPSHEAASLFSAGPCNFRELTAGHLCGCRRFWQRSRKLGFGEGQNRSASLVEGTGYCYCGHHACYHGQEQDTSMVERLVKREDVMVLEDSSAFTEDTTRTLRTIEQGRSLLHSPKPSLEIRQRRQSHRQLSHASSISDCVSRGGSHMSPGLVPSQHSRLSLHARTSASLLDDRSSTELAPTPSIAGSPEIRASGHASDRVKALQTLELDPRTNHRDDVVGTRSEPATQEFMSRNRLTMEQLLRELLALRATISSIPNIKAAVSGIHGRLDAIEHVASTHDVPEDLMERLERLESVEAHSTELEARLEELEQLKELLETRATTASFERRYEEHSHRHYSQVEGVVERLDHVEKRLLSLESSKSPSRQSPWEVEVVVLPFGRELNGLWAETEDLPFQCAWSRMVSSTSSAHGAANWFSPRACAPGNGLSGVIYARLRSRGFVRTIHITDGSAHHLQSQLCSTYGDLLPLLTKPISNTPRQTTKQFLALQSPLIPLRKLHKVARLQYLTPAEMITPTMWTATFLESSVFMKAPRLGLRRLYVTTAEAYMQDMQKEPDCDLSWNDLKHTPTRFRGSGDHGDDENTNRWTWEERLDEPQSVLRSEHSIRGPSRSSSPFESEDSDIECAPLASAKQSPPATPSPQIKQESFDNEHFTQVPITPSSMYPSSQPRRHDTLRSSRTIRVETQDTVFSSSPVVPAPSSQKRRVTSSFESRGSVDSDTSSGTPAHTERATRLRKKGRYDAILVDKTIRDEDDSAAMAYATPHSLFPGIATPKDNACSGSEDIGGDTDVAPDDGSDMPSHASMHEDRAPARLITSMDDLTMRDCGDSNDEEGSEGTSSSGSEVDESTDDDYEGYDADAWLGI